MLLLFLSCSALHLNIPGPLSHIGKTPVAYRSHLKSQPVNNQLQKKKKPKSGFRFPVEGRLSSVFGYRTHPISKKRKKHKGIDIAAPKGTKIYAIHKGVVSYAGKRGSFGNLIIIDHNETLQSYYAHCSKLKVRKGQKVTQKTIIATVGSTGRSTGPHLHLEIRKKGNPIDPLKLLKK